MKRILGCVFLVVMSACGATAPKEIVRDDSNVVGKGDGNGAMCGDESLTEALNPRLLQISNLNGQKMRMCDVMKNIDASGSKLAILQFTNVGCLGCEDEADEIRAYINNNNLSATVKHFVIFVDNQADTAVRIAEFMQNHGQIATRLDDVGGATALKLHGPDIEFPLSMIINNKGQYQIKKYSDKSSKLLNIVQSLLASAK